MSAYHFPFSGSNTVTSSPHSFSVFLPRFLSFNPSKFRLISFSSSRTNGNNNNTKFESTGVKYKNQDFYPKSSEPISNSGSEIKAHTAPWMNGPLLVKPNEILELTKPRTKKDYSVDRDGEHPDIALTGKVGGGRGKVAMKKIFKGIEKLQEALQVEEIPKYTENVRFKFAPTDLWGNGGYGNDAEVKEDSEVGQETLENIEFVIPFAEVEKEGKLKKLPWERDDRKVIRRLKKEKVVTAAELSLDGELLKRLRGEAAIMRKWVKVKKAGVTQAIVDQVIIICRKDELALLKFDLPLCRNMDRAREIIELKTGGVVVWSNKDFLAVYRGCNYVSSSKHFLKIRHDSACDHENSLLNENYQKKHKHYPIKFCRK